MKKADFEECNTVIQEETELDKAIRKLRDIENSLSYHGETTDELIKAKEEVRRLHQEEYELLEELDQITLYHLIESSEQAKEKIVKENFTKGRKGNFNIKE